MSSPSTNNQEQPEVAVSEQQPVQQEQHQIEVEAVVQQLNQLDKEIIEYGDQVVFYESMNSMKIQTLVQNGFFQNRFGYFGHSEIVGQSYGSKVFNLKRNAFIYLLRPDPILLTDTLSHKTQILYQADISYVIAKMNILPGSIVVESGTGSASLSSSIARTLQNEGHLFTFEFNEARAKNGVEVLKAQGLNNFDVIWRDVITNGFMPIKGEQIYGLRERMADAVFLDLPRPFEAIGHAKQVLKRGGWLCCFSPCIEQVMRNCEEMRNFRFIQITTVEILQRTFERKEKTLQSGFAVEQLPNPVNQKRKREDIDEDGEDEEDVEKDEGEEDEDEGEKVNTSKGNNKGKKAVKKQQKEQTAVVPTEKQVEEVIVEESKKLTEESTEKPEPIAGEIKVQRLPPGKMVRATTTKQMFTNGAKEIKGHTGYLSFGILM